MTSFKSLTRIAAIGLALAAGLLAMAQKPALAQSSSWTNVNGGSWPNSSNWSAGVASGAGNTADLRSSMSGQKFIDLDTSRTIGNLRFGSGGQLNYFTLRTGSSGSVLTLSVTTGTSFIDVQSGRNAEISAVMAGTQGFQKLSAGTLYLSGSSTYSGTTWVTAGNIELAGSGELGATGAGNETVVSGTARVRVGNGVSTAESFIISGTGNGGVGALNFGSNLAGDVTSTATGLVTLAADATIGAATFQGTANGTLDRGGAGNSVDNAGFNLSFAGSGNLTVNSPIVGSGAFTMNGSGNVYLTAANTYTGTTGWTTANGTLWLGNGGTGGSLSTSSAITLSNASAKFGVNQTDTVTQGNDFSGLAINGPGQFIQAGSGTTILTAANSFSGATAVNAGALQLGNAGTAGGLSASSAITIQAGANLIVNRSNAASQGTDFSTAAITGGGGFIQAGSGTTTLNAANSYTGATVVNAGKLLINGDQSAANGAVTVAAGATLGGSGMTGGAVTVNGILSPGNSPGVLTVASVVLGASSTSLFEINTTTRGTGYDGLNVTTDNGLTYGGALSLSFGNGSAFANSTTFDLFNFTGTPSGNFSSVMSTGFYAGTWTLASGTWSLTTSEQKLTFTPSTGDLVIAVPEPSTIVLLGGLAVVGFFARRLRQRRDCNGRPKTDDTVSKSRRSADSF